MAAVLLDVGGTLWPDNRPPSGGHESQAAARLQEVLRNWDPALASRFLKVSLPGFESGPGQDTDGAICRFGESIGLTLSREEAANIRRALCIPAFGYLELFPGAENLLRSIKAWGHQVALVSNAITRDGQQYLEDFGALGVGSYVDAAVTSIEVGFLKPHPAMFEAALAVMRCNPRQAAMVGNSETNDILPAKAMGMFTVRVCIEEPLAKDSAADATVGSLAEARDALQTWSSH